MKPTLLKCIIPSQTLNHGEIYEFHSIIYSLNKYVIRIIDKSGNIIPSQECHGYSIKRFEILSAELCTKYNLIVRSNQNG